MEAPNFRYLQDVTRFLVNLDKEIDDDADMADRLKHQSSAKSAYANYLDGMIKNCVPRITEANLARASLVGTENFKIQAALETFVITQKGRKNPNAWKNRKVDLNLEKVKVPNLKELKSQYSLADDLYHKYMTLQSVESQITMQFRDSRDLPKVLQSVKASKRRVEVALRKVFDYLGGVASKHVPESFQKYVAAIAQELSDHVVFRSSRSFMYVNISDTGNLIFTAYILLEDALNEEGELTPSLYVSLQWDQGSEKNNEPSSLKLWLDHEFEMPQQLERRPDGAEVDSVNGAARAIGRLLDIENFSSSIGVIPLSLQLKVDPSAINKKNFSFRDYVQRVEVDTATNTLRFTLARVRGVDKASVQKIAVALYPEVQQMLRVGRSAKMRMKTYRKDDNWYIDFIVTELAKGNRVSVDDLEFLKDRFGLNDRQLRRISDVFSSGE